MKYGKFLQKGGTIGFVAPSFGCATEPYRSAFNNALKKWRAMGYHTDLGPNCYEAKGIGISNKPKVCGEELTEYYLSNKNDCLISCGGGELMCEVLDYVDWEALKDAPPKWYMGYSDNTNMTFLLATLCDTASIYGPCAAAFGMEPWHRSLQDAMKVLTGEACRDEMKFLASEEEKTACKAVPQKEDNLLSIRVHGYDLWEKESLKNEETPLLPYNVTEFRITKLFQNGVLTEGKENPAVTFRGRLIGGCMDCLVNLTGTCYDKTADFLEKYKEDGFIWFLESCDLNVFSIRRAMWQMEHAGWFQYVKGFLIGRPMNGNEMMGLDAMSAALEVAGRKGVPVVLDVDLGHLPPMMPIIMGSLGTVSVEGNDISVEMKLI